MKAKEDDIFVYITDILYNKREGFLLDSDVDRPFKWVRSEYGVTRKDAIFSEVIKELLDF